MSGGIICTGRGTLARTCYPLEPRVQKHATAHLGCQGPRLLRGPLEGVWHDGGRAWRGVRVSQTQSRVLGKQNRGTVPSIPRCAPSNCANAWNVCVLHRSYRTCSIASGWWQLRWSPARSLASRLGLHERSTRVRPRTKKVCGMEGRGCNTEHFTTRRCIALGKRRTEARIRAKLGLRTKEAMWAKFTTTVPRWPITRVPKPSLHPLLRLGCYPKKGATIPKPTAVEHSTRWPVGL